MATLTEFLTNLANKIREVQGINDKLTPNEMISDYLRSTSLAQPTLSVSNEGAVSSTFIQSESLPGYVRSGTKSEIEVDLTKISGGEYLQKANIKNGVTVLGVQGEAVGTSVTFELCEVTIKYNIRTGSQLSVIYYQSGTPTELNLKGSGTQVITAAKNCLILLSAGWGQPNISIDNGIHQITDSSNIAHSYKITGDAEINITY